MPEPIGPFNSSLSEHYDLERGMCVDSAPVTSRGGTTQASGSAGRNEAAMSGCNARAAQAGLTCARAVAGALEVAPTLVGGLVAAFLGGAACGFAVMEWRECRDAEAHNKP